MNNFRSALIFVVAFIGGTTFGAVTYPYLAGRERLANENKTLEELLERARMEITEVKSQLKH